MTMPGYKRVYVLRHAKSAWPEGVDDRERPLAGRGRRDAPAAGRWLRTAGRLPDLVVCSPARRTRETWELVRGELAAEPSAVYDDRLYAAELPELLGVLRETPEEVRAVLLIAHQPGVQELTLALAGDAAGDSLDRAREKFPTSAVAVLSVDGPWSGLAPGCARLTEFIVARGPKK
ncbi:SixA phosphatase family protein [Streptantibioticus ferralitis]|uniref:Histidine phosphatase family protein n=1 Tax=Streptantibioticus ferralitis TaxID=236510 RepID=A0ABT5YTM8_9ACTN|nr:histidine phosphatase family protein [Streptantibioticus ferralitis]MDF2254967.1 histidine phosphatase family protein [Streptantibioticus ferralitis]